MVRQSSIASAQNKETPQSCETPWGVEFYENNTQGACKQMVVGIIPKRQVSGGVKPVGTLWPNGEFSMGYAHGAGLEKLESAAEYAEKWDRHLGLSIGSNSHSPKDEGRAPRGTKGLTSRGKRLLRNSVHRMQRLHGKGRMAFVTLTLPSVDFVTAWNISTDWSRIVRVFFQKLGRYLERLGLPSQYASCTEMQTERMQTENHPGLHLHFVIVTKRRGQKGWAITPGEIRWLWASVLGPMCPGVEFWGAVENIQRIRKDAGAYMAKYMSKGCSMDEPPRRDGTGWSLPTAWYNICMPIKRWVTDNIRKSPELFELIESALKSTDYDEIFHYVFSGVIEFCPGPGPHYWVGKFKGAFHGELIEIWRSHVLSGG